MAFQLYHGGVLTKNCGTRLDHGVLVVGYGSDSGLSYWKVKNSWGTSFGEQGYIRLERTPAKRAGECGINSEPSYPVVRRAPGPAPGPTPPAPPTPAPPSPPAPAPATHYEHPPCQSDEMAAQVQGLSGVLCAPHCSASGGCPTDKPDATLAQPRCMLQGPQGERFCALSCLFSLQCPKGAQCAHVGLAGLCVYPDAATGLHVPLSVAAGNGNSTLVV